MRNWSNMAFLLATILILMLCSLSISEARYAKKPSSFKQARAIRGFKSMPLQVGRGFGKRANNLDFLTEFQENGLNLDDDLIPESNFPIEWLANKMDSNPEIAKTILRKFVDTNGDEQVSLDELLRPVY